MKNGYKIVTDKKFGYLRIDPVPTQEEVDRYYKEEFYSSNYTSFNDSSLNVQKEEEEFFNSRWGAVCDFCSSHFDKSRELSLFDVGFGFAQALLYFRDKGLKVSGLEPSPEGVEYAKSKGLDVYLEGIEDFSFVGEKRFDVVTIFNVLEHLRNPGEILVKLRNQLLKKDGLLVIDVPNEFNDFQTIANSEFSLGEWWVCPPNHINYFSVDSIRKLLEQCGYDVIYFESSFPLELFLLMGDVYVGNGELGKTCHNKRVKFEYLMKKHGRADTLHKFYHALAEVGLGRQITVYAVPQKA